MRDRTRSWRFPTFDHALKDPVDDGIELLPEHDIVMVEGLYVCLDLEPWKEAASSFDDRWVITVDEETARERIVARHLAAGIAATRLEALLRAETSDLPSEYQADRSLSYPYLLSDTWICRWPFSITAFTFSSSDDRVRQRTVIDNIHSFNHMKSSLHLPFGAMSVQKKIHFDICSPTIDVDRCPLNHSSTRIAHPTPGLFVVKPTVLPIA